MRLGSRVTLHILFPHDPSFIFMDEKSITIKKIKNRYIISKFCFKGEGEDREYHTEEFVLKEPSEDILKLFDEVVGEKVVSPKDREKKSFEDAEKEAEKEAKYND